MAVVNGLLMLAAPCSERPANKVFDRNNGTIHDKVFGTDALIAGRNHEFSVTPNPTFTRYVRNDSSELNRLKSVFCCLEKMCFRNLLQTKRKSYRNFSVGI